MRESNVPDWFWNNAALSAVASKKMVVSISLLLLSFTLLSCGGGGGGNGDSESNEDAPIVASVDPLQNDVSVLLGTAISALFDLKMNPASETRFFGIRQSVRQTPWSL
jgi:hypothetical protein